MNAAQLRMRNRLRNLAARYDDVPDLAEILSDQEQIDRDQEQRRSHVTDLYATHIVIDPIEDESLDGGRLTCTRCGLSSDHESMAAAAARGWAHVQECGEQA